MSYTVIDYYEDNMFSNKKLLEKLTKDREKYLKLRNTASRKLDNSMFVYQGKIELIDELLEMLRR